MGYHVSSVYAVCPNDTHAFFIYFMPAGAFELRWVNEWVEEYFLQIAETIPQQGVIIAPSRMHTERYFQSLLQIENTAGFFSRVYPSVTGRSSRDNPLNANESVLRDGMPFIIFSHTPMHQQMNTNEAVVIRLASCKNQTDLGKVIDILFSIIKSDDMVKLEGLQQILDPPSRPSQSVTAIKNINQAVDLKSNSSSSTRTQVFISYSHKDVRYLKQLQTHLAYYERVGLIEVWDDTKLLPGAMWHDEIKNALRRTKVAILLVSAAFLASKFIAENELPPLLTAAQSEGAVILSVILSACAFEETPLAQFQAVISPSKPLLSMSKSDKEKTWHLVAKTVKEAINSQPAIEAIEEMSKQAAEKKVTQEIPAEYEKQLQQQMIGLLDFRQAINARDWKQAEKVLQKHPSFPEARSSLGLGISREVQEHFYSQLNPFFPLQLESRNPAILHSICPSSTCTIHTRSYSLVKRSSTVRR